MTSIKAKPLGEFSKVNVSCTPFTRRGVEERLESFFRNRDHYLYVAAFLEGNSFSLDEVRALLNGYLPENKPDSEIRQVKYLLESADILYTSVASRSFSIYDWDLRVHINGVVGAADNVRVGVYRAGTVADKSLRVTLRGKYTYFIPYVHNPDPLKDEFAQYGVPNAFENLLNSCENPVELALNQAAAATYCQFFYDGNKRTSRFMMDGHLMSNGYSHVRIPIERSKEFIDSVVNMYITASFEPYVHFMESVLLNDPLATT